MSTEERLTAIEEQLSSIRQAIDEASGAAIRATERVETSLLTEFHKWAGPLEARMRTHTALLRAVDLEIESIADRVTKLEPPQ